MWWIIAIVAVLVILFVNIFAISNKCANIMLYPKMKYGKEAMQGETDFWGFDESFYNSYDKTPFDIHSDYGYTLKGEYIRTTKSNSDGKKRVVVIAHGFTSSRFGSVKYARIYLDFGFDCVIYDHRNHGDSDKNFTSMGYYEKDDLKKVCDMVREKYKNEPLIIGTHGESMGAATVMLEAGIDNELNFAVEDCGYSTLEDQIKNTTRETIHLMQFPFIPVAALISKIKCGFWVTQVRPMDAVSKSSCPMLFIHGEDDKFVPYSMLKVNYDAKNNGYKEMYSVKSAGHAESVVVDYNAYRNKLHEFLTNIKAI